jgi:hypothetical protein
MNTSIHFDNYYQIYLDKIIALTRTITIKSEETANSLNSWIRLKYGSRAVSENKEEWLYYRNICGEYHFSNTKMTVVSMDTLEEIEFNKENLKKHTATKAAYQYGTRRYEELVTRYPDQEMLILGILYPANMEQAIDADNYTILSYPSDLVEKNEYSFIYLLQEWIYGFTLRWFNTNYCFSDPKITLVYMGLLYSSMIPAIINIRKSLCKTNEAHSYHVQRQLASHGFLDDYLDVMTTNQSLKFYKNINWLERNIGTSEAQEWLYANALTERNIPIAEYNIKHNTKYLVNDLKPTVLFEKKSINGLEVISDVDNLSLTGMLARERDVAKGNTDYISHSKNDINEKITSSLSNHVKTKVLESSMTDYSNSNPVKLEDVLLNLWLDLAERKLFVSVILFNDPITGESLNLPASDAFILYYYAYLRWQTDLKLKYIPPFFANRIPRNIFYTKDIPKTKLPNDFKDEVFLDRITELMIRPEVMISVSTFYNFCNRVYRNANLQLDYVAMEEHLMTRSYKELAVNMFYCDRFVDLIKKDHVLYEEWLSEKNIDYRNYTKNDWGLLAKSILEYATSLKSNSVESLRAIQTAMLRLTKQLSSYSVQFIQEIHDSNELMSGFLTIREGDVLEKEKSSLIVDGCSIKVLDLFEKEREFLGQIPLLDKSDWVISEHESEKIDLDPTVDIESNPTNSKTYLNIDCGIDVLVKLPDISNLDPGKMVIIPGIDSFIKLDQTERAMAVDVWGRDYWYPNKCDKNSNNKIPLSWDIINPNLDGFDYVLKSKLKLKDEVDGFDYDCSDRLYLKSHVDGFDYTPKPELILKDEVDGFDYLEKTNFSMLELFDDNKLNGLVRSNDAIDINDLFTGAELIGYQNYEMPDLSKYNVTLGDVHAKPGKIEEIKDIGNSDTLVDNIKMRR